MPDKASRLIPTFGSYRKRRLKEDKQELLDNLLPELLLPEDFSGDPEKLFPHNPKEIIFEIGFGDGLHLAHQAETNPEAGFIGSEIYINGIASLLKEIAAKKISNIRIFNQDARLLLAKLPPASLDKIFILFPDPWPKARHHKRRIISQETLEVFYNLLKKGGELRLATDWHDYANWMMVHITSHGKFLWQADSKSGWQTPPPNHITTKYQEKAAEEGRNPIFINLMKK